jgi:hypothetical protein
MYYLTDALKMIKNTDNSTVCVFGEHIGYRFHYVDRILHCEEPDGIGYSVTLLNSLPKDNSIWFIEED